MGKAERIEIEDFVQNIVERMETPEAFEKMISREEECEAQGQESRLRDGRWTKRESASIRSLIYMKKKQKNSSL